MSLKPPCEGTFPTRAEAQQHVQTWAKAQGYAVVVTNSAIKKGFVYLGCDKSGTYKNSHKVEAEDRRCKTFSAKSACPFRVRLRANAANSWELTVMNGEHNHDASASALAHAVQRRFDVATKHQIIDMARLGTKPKQIAAMLLEREEPITVTTKDISNLLAIGRRDALAGRAPAEALLEWLKEQDWPHAISTAAVGDQDNRLESIFFAHPESLHLLRRFGAVTLIDATYNTNQHRLPLLHFVGLTSSNRSFTIGLAFLKDESAVTYTWALQALRQLEPDWLPEVVVTDDEAALGAALGIVFEGHNFAHMHFQWHVRQNVEKYARTRLPDNDDFNNFMSDFDELRDARTIQALDDNRESLVERWGEKHQNLVAYIDLKLSSQQHWVSAYVDRHPHLGQRNTSRVEGAHATMKNYLHSRHGNLYNVTKQLKHHFLVQLNLVASDLANDLHKVPVAMLGMPFYANIAKTVSHFALNIIWKQDEVARRLLALYKKATCECILRTTMGIPCCHQIAQWRAANLPFPLSWIHPQWRTTAGLEGVRVPRPLDPLNPQQRRIVAATTSSGRLLTGAELAAAAQKKRIRRCRNCHQQGHNCNTCPVPCGKCQSKEHSLNQCTM